MKFENICKKQHLIKLIKDCQHAEGKNSLSFISFL
jgi:hypothetical protein